MNARLLITLSLLCLPATGYAAASHSISEIRTLIASAAAAHAKRVVIPPGVYRGGLASGNAVILPIQNIDDLKIVAKDVLMVCTMRTRAVEFDNCRNVEMEGLRIDYDPLTFTQGTVTATAPDKSWIDVTLDAGYPRMPFSRIDVVDPHTRFRVHGMPFLWGTKAALVKPNVVRVTLKGIGDAAPVGSLTSLNDGNEAGGVCHGIDLENCKGGMVLRDVTLYCAPGMGIVEHGGAGGTRLLGVRIVPGPTPAGAAEPRLLTTSWDGILHAAVRKGPDVENCRIEDCGDDSWSDQSGPMLVVKSQDNQVVLAGGSTLLPGDRICRSLASSPLKVMSVRTVPINQAGLDSDTMEKLDKAPQWTLWAVDHQTVQVATLDSASSHDVGTSFYSPDNQGNGFIFRNNYVYSSGRLLIKASDGLIEGNTLIDGHNVVVDPEVAAGAAFGIENIAFRDNTVIGVDNSCNAPWSSQAGAFSGVAGAIENGKKTFAAAGNFVNFDIEDNTFEDVAGVSIALAGVQGAKLLGNKFIKPHSETLSNSGADYGIDQAAVIFLRNCKAVTLKGNKVVAPGRYEKRVLDDDATNSNSTDH